MDLNKRRRDCKIPEKIISAIGQLEITPDKDTNLKRALSLVKRAIQLKADLIVLPEVMNTGFYPENYLNTGSIEEELNSILRLSERRDIIIVAGVAEKDGERLYNSVAIIYRGEIIDKYRKILLFKLTSEHKYFHPGKELKVVETPIGKFGILVCYEIRFPEISRKLIKMGAEVLIIPAEFPKERIEHWRLLLKARAVENLCYVIGANCVGGNLNYPGNSMIVDPLGNVICEAGNVQEILVGVIDYRNLREIRMKYPFLNDLRDGFY